MFTLVQQLELEKTSVTHAGLLARLCVIFVSVLVGGLLSQGRDVLRWQLLTSCLPLWRGGVYASGHLPEQCQCHGYGRNPDGGSLARRNNPA